MGLGETPGEEERRNGGKLGGINNGMFRERNREIREDQNLSVR